LLALDSKPLGLRESLGMLIDGADPAHRRRDASFCS